jgi:hypothetical protein
MSLNFAKHFDELNWAFVPGPLDDGAPMSSLDLKQQVEYVPKKIAAMILAYPGFRLHS